MKNLKLFYGSSYDRLNMWHHMMYHNIYAKACGKGKTNLRFLSERILGVSKQNKMGQSKRIQIPFLFKSMQVRGRQKKTRLLEKQKDAHYSKEENVGESRRCVGQQKPKLARWAENKQRWLYSIMETRTPRFRLSWICERTPTCNGKQNWKKFSLSGGSSPY